MSRSTLLAILALIILLLSGCHRRPAAAATLPRRIVVTMAPLSGLVESLAPAGSEVTVLIRPGMSCHGFEPTPADVAALRRADVVVYVGLGLEAAVEEYLAKHRKADRHEVCFSRAARIDDADHHHDHDDHEHDGHHHHAVDPHLWVDPSLVERLIPALAQAIRDSLAADGLLDAAARTAADDAERALLDRVRALDDELRVTLAPVAGRPLVTHHAAFERFATRYGLRVAAVIQPLATDEPTPAEIAAAVEALKRESASAVFVEPQFNQAVAAKIAAAAGARLGRLDALGDGDWFALLRRNALEIRKTLSPDAP